MYILKYFLIKFEMGKCGVHIMYTIVKWARGISISYTKKQASFWGSSSIQRVARKCQNAAAKKIEVANARAVGTWSVLI